MLEPAPFPRLEDQRSRIARTAGWALAALGLVLAAPAAALDLTKVPGLGGGDWTAKTSRPELVVFSCATPACPPSGQLSVSANATPDAARDEIIDDPQGSLAGYRKSFEKGAFAKACAFESYKAEKAGDAASRIEIEGDCPSGLVIAMTTVFDKSQSGSITVAASAMDRAKARALRAKSTAAVEAAIAAAR